MEELMEECGPYTAQGRLADYIPELSKGDLNDLGIYVMRSDGKHYQAGSYNKPFTIQSVIKPILLLLALMDNGTDVVRSHVGVEATGKPFDAINAGDQSLDSGNINPMVNMGAIAMCTLVKGRDYEERFGRLLELTRQLADNPEVEVDESVYLSEKRTGNKNRALAFLLKSSGIISDDVEEVLDCYFRACSIKVTCKDLAHISYILANRGKRLQTDERLFPSQYARYVNAVLMTCGMYDGSGDFAVKVGVPAKSGVGAASWPLSPPEWGSGYSPPAWTAKATAWRGSSCWSCSASGCT